MFGQLPSYVLANGNMFDLVVANTLAEWENGLTNPGAKKSNHPSEEEMLNMIKAVRSKQ